MSIKAIADLNQFLFDSLGFDGVLFRCVSFQQVIEMRLFTDMLNIHGDEFLTAFIDKLNGIVGILFSMKYYTLLKMELFASD